MNPQMATDTAATAANALTPEMAGASMSLLQRFQGGGFFMWPILFVGIVSLFIVLERLYALYGKTKFDKAAILSEVRNAIYSGRLVVVGTTLIHQIIQAGF